MPPAIAPTATPIMPPTGPATAAPIAPPAAPAAAAPAAVPAGCSDFSVSGSLLGGSRFSSFGFMGSPCGKVQSANRAAQCGGRCLDPDARGCPSACRAEERCQPWVRMNTACWIALACCLAVVGCRTQPNPDGVDSSTQAGRDGGTDAGPADAGPSDAGPPPPDPHRIGGLGPGPWPAAPITVYGSAQGLLEAPISASTDEA